MRVTLLWNTFRSAAQVPSTATVTQVAVEKKREEDFCLACFPIFTSPQHLHVPKRPVDQGTKRGLLVMFDSAGMAVNFIVETCMNPKSGIESDGWTRRTSRWSTEINLILPRILERTWRKKSWWRFCRTPAGTIQISHRGRAGG